MCFGIWNGVFNEERGDDKKDVFCVTPLLICTPFVKSALQQVSVVQVQTCESKDSGIRSDLRRSYH